MDSFQQGGVITWNQGGADKDLNCKGVAATEAREGEKVDLGRGPDNVVPRKWLGVLEIESGTAPTAGGTVELYWAQSADGTNWPAGVSGADGDWKNGEEDEWKKQLGAPVCVLVGTNDANAEQRETFEMTVSARYGAPVLVNELDQALRDAATPLPKLTLYSIA